MKSRELIWTVAVGAAGLAILAIYCWPGLMVYDSTVQLAEARAHAYTDWHPPVMAAIWSVLDRIVAGPALMFVLQVELFVIGLYTLFRRFTSRRGAAFTTLLLLLYPPVLAALSIVVKDNLMCGALLVGIAMLTSPRRNVRLGSLVFWWLAAAVRVNGFSLVIPLVAWLSPWPAARGTWARRAMGAAIGIAVSGGGWLANAALRPEKAHMFDIALAPPDIVGTICFAPPLGDDEVRTLLDGVSVQPKIALQAYACALQNPHVHPEKLIHSPHRFFDDPKTAEGRAAFATVWWRVITKYPGAYLWNRFDRFGTMIGFPDPQYHYFPVWVVQYETRMLVAIGYEPTPHGSVQRMLGSRMAALANDSHVLFRPYLYVVFSLLLAIACRKNRLVIALQLSSAIALALVFFVAPGPDTRYAQWTMIEVLVSVAIYLMSKQARSGVAGGAAHAGDVEPEQRAVAHDDGAVDRDVPDVA